MQVDLFTGETIIDIGIARLREFEPPEGYYGAFSGGKDSCAIKELSKMAGVKVDWHYAATTIDPPELVKFIKRNHPDVQFHRPKMRLLDAMPYHKTPPTRLIRWCCRDLKEEGGRGRIVMTGVRWAESARRKSSRKMVEQCYRHTDKRFVNPIIDWTTEDVWWFIHKTKIPYCELYDEGFERLGCVMCPVSTPTNRAKEAERWPRIKDHWWRAFKAMWDAPRKETSIMNKFASLEDMFEWWMTQPPSPDDDQEHFPITDN